MGFVPSVVDIRHADPSMLRNAVRGSALVLARGLELDTEHFERLVRSLGPLARPWDATEAATKNFFVQDMRVKPSLGDFRTASSSQYWHSDQSFSSRPPAFTGLYCLIAPRMGGGTQFCHSRLTGSPENLMILPLAAKAWIRHSFADSLAELLRGRRRPEHLRRLCKRYPDVWHPMVRIQPRTVARSWFLSPLTARAIQIGRKEEPVCTNEEYINLLKVVICKNNIYTHEWRAGDLLLWDNAAVMHRREIGTIEGERLHWRAVTRGVKVRAVL